MSGAQMRRQLTPAVLLVAIVVAAFLLAMSPVGTSALSPAGTAVPGPTGAPALSAAGRTVAGAFQARTLTVDDLRLEVSLSDPQLSPDGRSVVVVTSRPDYDENRFDRQLVLVDVASGARRDLTPGRVAVGRPRWSPSGGDIAFTDSGNDGGPRQIFILPVGGGEARQATYVERGVGAFEWSADGAQLLFTTTDAPEKREGEERHNRSFEVGHNSYLTQRAPTSSHLWWIAVEADSNGTDAPEPERLTEGTESISGFVVSPDGRTVALSVMPRPHSGEGIRSFIRLLDLDSGRARDLSLDPPVYLGTFSPDGSYLTFRRSRGPEPYFNPSGLFMVPVDGGDAIDITGEIDRNLGGGPWMPDGQSLLVIGTDLTTQAFWHQPLDGSPVRIDLGKVHPSSLALAGSDSTIVFVGREPHRPSELYIMRAGEWGTRRLTDFNAALASMKLGAVETIYWDGPDGFAQNGVLVYPPGFEQGRQYPLVLSIHGGPMGTSTEGFSTFHQILAAQGWLVFSPNYRGSSTQGKAFQRAVVNDAGEGPGRDVMSTRAA
jgi:dipeptidyl aminopeptidase/acylaminoacyl peptidase